MTNNKPHAIALFSGGLDSALAILLLLKQDIEVTALTFMTHFGCDLGDRSSCGSNPYPTAEQFGFNVKLMHLGDKFIDIVANPKHGRGANMNPCVDCRILMLREATAYMELVKADFIVTGEVIGQRPFSQVLPKMGLVQRKSGLGGKLLRPLSAKLLDPTDPELSGMVDREQLEGISGRSRKRQMALAKEFGLDDYPSPASGCLLTDSSYSARLRDLMTYSDRLTFTDLNLLRAGRHYRLNDQTKLIVGRHEEDNKRIEAEAKPHHYRLEATEIGSPLSLIIGCPDQETIALAAKITARYSSGKNQPLVEVEVISEKGRELIMVPPAKEEEYTHLALI